MKIISKFLLISLVLILPVLMSGCITTTKTAITGEQGQDIISAEETLALLEESGSEVVLVDAQKARDYKAGHVSNAVNISRSEIVVLGPFPNMLAPREKIEKALGKSGISNDTMVIVYDDNNNVDASRFWWTLKVYGHQKMKVVSGGLKALLAAGAEQTAEVPVVTPVNYTVSKKNTELIAALADVKTQLDQQADDVVLLDTRTPAEYNNGTIPGSILLDNRQNNYKDGTIKSVRDIHIIYREADVDPEKTIILYCRSGMRATHTLLALHNAGYRNLKLYDGSWSEWSSDSSLPVQLPSGNKVEANFQDGS